jgi:hypothetical protein
VFDPARTQETTMTGTVARPGVEVSALELSDAVAGHPGVSELDEAGSWADPARADRLEGEHAALLAVVARATGLARRLRDAVRTGGWCRYEPDPGRPVRWVLDGPADPPSVSSA